MIDAIKKRSENMERLREEHPKTWVEVLEQATAREVAFKKAMDRLWGFWDGNTLIARPGCDVEALLDEAWDDLLAASIFPSKAGIALLERLAELETQVTDLKTDLTLNATMLAQQCDLAREAEAETEHLREALRTVEVRIGPSTATILIEILGHMAQGHKIYCPIYKTPWLDGVPSSRGGLNKCVHTSTWYVLLRRGCIEEVDTDTTPWWRQDYAITDIGRELLQQATARAAWEREYEDYKRERGE